MDDLLTTPRLLLRELTTEDAEPMYSLNLDPQVIRYTGDRPFQSISEAEDFLARYDLYERYAMGRLAVIRQQDKQWLGWCGLKYHPDKDLVDLGFRFFRRYWGKGYATESGRACLEYGFKQLKLKEIIAHAIKANLASIRVLEKLGFSDWSPFDFEGEQGRQGKIKNPYF